MSKRSGLRGDLTRITSLSAALRREPTSIAEQVARETAPPITTFSRASFRAQESVQGKPWAASPGRPTPTLVASGSVQDSIGFVSVGTQMRAVLGPRNYRGVQYGAYLIGRYEILPNKSIPDGWKPTIRDNADRAFEAYTARMKGKGTP